MHAQDRVRPPPCSGGEPGIDSRVFAWHIHRELSKYPAPHVMAVCCSCGLNLSATAGCHRQQASHRLGALGHGCEHHARHGLQRARRRQVARGVGRPAPVPGGEDLAESIQGQAISGLVIQRSEEQAGPVLTHLKPALALLSHAGSSRMSPTVDRNMSSALQEPAVDGRRTRPRQHLPPVHDGPLTLHHRRLSGTLPVCTGVA